jgi:hypothetical protein
LDSLFFDDRRSRLDDLFAAQPGDVNAARAAGPIGFGAGLDSMLFHAAPELD